MSICETGKGASPGIPTNVEFQPKPRLETVVSFVVRAWQRLGLPDTLQVDNSDVFGLTSHPS